MQADTGHRPKIIRADGGLVASQFVCQFIADILNIPLEIPRVAETTALGAAYLAGLQAGVYQDLNEIATHWHRAHFYKPKMQTAARQQLYSGWQKAVRAVIAEI